MFARAFFCAFIVIKITYLNVCTCKYDQMNNDHLESLNLKTKITSLLTLGSTDCRLLSVISEFFKISTVEEDRKYTNNMGNDMQH